MSSAVWEAIAELIAKGGKEKTGEGQGEKEGEGGEGRIV